MAVSTALVQTTNNQLTTTQLVFIHQAQWDIATTCFFQGLLGDVHSSLKVSGLLRNTVSAQLFF